MCVLLCCFSREINRLASSHGYTVGSLNCTEIYLTLIISFCRHIVWFTEHELKNEPYPTKTWLDAVGFVAW